LAHWPGSYERREALAETGRDVEGGGRTMAEQADAVQRVAQFAELFVD